MKSYTDLEQSKKLAEILPIESVDIFYRDNGIDAKLMWEHNAQKVKYPCWSLAALLSVLDFPSLTQNKEDEWEVCVPDHKYDGYIEVSADNPVDACVEMIIKLHELKML